MRKMTKENFVVRAQQKHGNKFDYTETIWLGAEKKVRIKCNEHGYFDQLPNRHTDGAKCPECAKIIRGKVKTANAAKRFIDDARNIHGNKYGYDEVIYVKSSVGVKIKCYDHGMFNQLPNTHLSGAGCFDCGIEKSSKANALSNDEFLERAASAHNNKYGYSFVVYKNYATPIKILCHTHGIFEQTPHCHLNSGGCPECGREKINKASTKTKEEFVHLANAIHHNKYNYDLMEYVNCKLKVNIVCPIHGMFDQTPDAHLCGYGCGRCGGTKILNTALFISKSKEVHGDEYLYDKVEYFKSNDKVIIICKVHGEFLQRPNSHLSGRGCSKCVSVVSKPETNWLNSIGVPEEFRQIRIPLKFGSRKYVKVDGYDPETKTVYEFNGDFYHGNPKFYKSEDINVINKSTFGYLYNRTISREIAIMNAGYKLISIWESDWKLQKTMIGENKCLKKYA